MLLPQSCQIPLKHWPGDAGDIPGQRSYVLNVPLPPRSDEGMSVTLGVTLYLGQNPVVKSASKHIVTNVPMSLLVDIGSSHLFLETLLCWGEISSCQSAGQWWAGARKTGQFHN